MINILDKKCKVFFLFIGVFMVINLNGEIKVIMRKIYDWIVYKLCKKMIIEFMFDLVDLC